LLYDDLALHLHRIAQYLKHLKLKRLVICHYDTVETSTKTNVAKKTVSTMSNERRNPYYKKKNHKNVSSLSAAAGGAQAGAARTNETIDTSSLLRAAGTVITNQ
jgi:hypothetical protein